jgi:hypothetical protein
MSAQDKKNDALSAGPPETALRGPASPLEQESHDGSPGGVPSLRRLGQAA